ncbi:MAG: NlpC/P60 family protein [Fibromonadales bacterium]|nr:NlpC/P60 family protein [Fibromonadales bacterium]
MNLIPVFMLALFFISCAPLRPIAPEGNRAEKVQDQPTPPKVTEQKPKQSEQEKAEKTEPQNFKTITGIYAWDKILSPWLGVPYLYGGNTKSGTDCSGFTSNVYMEKEKKTLPRTSADQFKVGTSVDRKDLIIGDLVFFNNLKSYHVSHVGIYVGKGNFIHASTKRGIIVSSLDERHWVARYMGARRYL